VAKLEIAKLSTAPSPSPINSTVEFVALVKAPDVELVLVIVLVRIVPLFVNVPSTLAAKVPVPTVITPLLTSAYTFAALELESATVALLPRGTVVLAVIVSVRVVAVVTERLMVTRLKVLFGASKDVSAVAYVPLSATVPEL
jgi:hypothetical protein